MGTLINARNKLDGVKYHLHRMEQLYPNDIRSFKHEFEAFLVKARSVFDVILEDFNEKFELGIGLEEKLNAKVFEDRSKQLGKTEALEFIRWWKNKKNEITSKPCFNSLFTKRNISVHRKIVGPDLQKIIGEEKISIPENVIVYVRRVDEKPINEIKSSEITPKPTEQPLFKIGWYIKECTEDDVLTVCKKLLKLLIEFLEGAENKFN